MNAITKNKIEVSLNYSHFYSGLSRSILPDKERARLEEQSTLIRYSKKTILFNEGETPKGVYVLIAGKIKFTQLNVDGSLHILSIYTTGDIFGYRSILSNYPHFTSAVALENCEVLFIKKEHFLDVVKSSDCLLNLLLQSTCHEYTVLANRINIFAQKSVKERLAYFLLILNEKYKLPFQLSDEAEIKINRSDLASYIGTSVEPLVRMLKEFRKKEYVRTDTRSIYINNFEALYSLTGIKD